MKLVSLKHCSDKLILSIYRWCSQSFGPGGDDKDWKITNEMTLIFWEDSHYSLFILKWSNTDG